MVLFRICKLICVLPFAWYQIIRCRKHPFDARYEIIHRWSKRILNILHISLVVEQAEPFPQDGSLFFVANHQGTFDPLILCAGIQIPFTFVSKQENQRIPLVSSVSKTLELIYFDREDTGSAVHMLRESARYLKRKQNLLIFPEGTRSKGKEMLPMKEGALHPAYLGKAWIIPVTQINAYAFVDAMKHQGVMKLVLHAPIPYEAYRSLDRAELCAQLQTIMSQK